MFITYQKTVPLKLKASLNIVVKCQRTDILDQGRSFKNV